VLASMGLDIKNQHHLSRELNLSFQLPAASSPQQQAPPFYAIFSPTPHCISLVGLT